MSKNIKQRNEELSKREQRLKFQLEGNEEELKDKAKTVGKIALISGLALLVGYWLFQLFFGEDEEEERPKKKKKKRRNPAGLRSRISSLATPYIIRFFEDFLELEKKEEPKKESLEN